VGHSLIKGRLGFPYDAKDAAMAIYQYRCHRDGIIDVRRPIGTAPPRYTCPTCASEAVRVFSAPMLSLASRPVVAAIDRAEKSRDSPELVSTLPRRPGPTRSLGGTGRSRADASAAAVSPPRYSHTDTNSSRRFAQRLANQGELTSYCDRGWVLGAILASSLRSTAAVS